METEGGGGEGCRSRRTGEERGGYGSRKMREMKEERGMQEWGRWGRERDEDNAGMRKM